MQHRGGRRTQNTGKASRTSAPQSAQPSAGVHKRTSAAAARTEIAAPVQTAKRNSSRRGKKKQEVEKPSLRVYFLGGLNEIGKNFTLFECEGDMIIVDCGMDDDTKRLAGIIEKSDQTKKLMSEEEFSCVWRR